MAGGILREGYIAYEEDGTENPFIHIKQYKNGEFVFRFPQIGNKKFDYYYTRHNNVIHTKTYYNGIEKEKLKTNIEKRDPVFSLDKIERQCLLLLTKTMLKRTSIEKDLKKKEKIGTIKGELYNDLFIPLVIHLNPLKSKEEIIQDARPVQCIHDTKFIPPLTISTFESEAKRSFIKMGAAVY